MATSFASLLKISFKFFLNKLVTETAKINALVSSNEDNRLWTPSVDKAATLCSYSIST